MNKKLLNSYDGSSVGDPDESSMSENMSVDSFILKKRDPNDLFGPLYLAGYLYKKPEGGTWHRRYFETNGTYLTYYKSNKMKKLLAAVNMPEVSEIKLVGDSADNDGKGFVFRMEIRDRIYFLRADTLPEAEKWIQVLNALRLEQTSPTFGSGGYDMELPRSPTTTTTSTTLKSNHEIKYTEPKDSPHLDSSVSSKKCCIVS